MLENPGLLPIGADSSKFPGAVGQDAFWVLEQASAMGLDGVFFRSLLELSPELDPRQLRDVADAARGLGLRLEAGAAKVNPFAAPEAPQVRELGGGDYLAGVGKMVQAAAGAGIHELWTATGNYQFRIQGLRACDRFRTDVSWADQLAATAKVLHRLAPVLRDNGVHLNLETHEEITSFEVVRLVEEVGQDVLGITFDTANVLVRCEDPAAAAVRVAPYVRSTHVRDAALVFTSYGIGRFLRPVGEGCLDWHAVLRPLLASGTMLSIEGITRSRGEMPLYVHDPEWQRGHPDLTPAEAFEVVRLTRDYEARAASGLAPDLQALRAPLVPGEQLEFLAGSIAALRAVLAELAAEQEQISEMAE